VSTQDKEQQQENIPLPNRRRGKWKLVLMGIVILSCGILIGHAATVHWIHHRMQQLIANPDKMPEEMLKRLRAKLDLTEEQASQVRMILLEKNKKFKEIHRETAPRVEKEFQDLRNKISQVLTPEQAKRWEKDYKSILPPPLPWGPPPDTFKDPPGN